MEVFPTEPSRGAQNGQKAGAFKWGLGEVSHRIGEVKSSRKLVWGAFV